MTPSLGVETTLRESLPQLQKRHITMSLVKDRVGLWDRLNRKIPSHYHDILMETFSLNNSVIDLGDSRKFKTSKELIDKINYIRGSKFYIGSKVSWKDIARIFGTYVLVLEPLPGE